MLEKLEPRFGTVTCPLRAANAYEKRVLPGLWTEPRLVVWRGMTGDGTRGAVEQIEVLDPKKLSQVVRDRYHNRSLTTVNDHEVRISVMTEPFRWHHHPDSDETFMGVEGGLIIEFRPARDRAPRRSDDHRPSGCAASHAT